MSSILDRFPSQPGYLLRHKVMTTSAIQRIAAILLVAVLQCVASPGYASKLQIPLPNGLSSNAEYMQGDKSKPALLVLHGFLQTYEFVSTRNIVNGLSTLGHSVLAPNLSMGVPNRQQSVQCTAIHAHTFETDLQEIAFWVDWLKQGGHQSVILVGHSWGSQHGLGFLEVHPDPAIKAMIAISLTRGHQSPAQNTKQIDQAEQRVVNKDTALHPYALSFCKEYMATPQSYLSYARWDDSRVKSALMKLKKRKMPVYMVLGGSDKRIDAKWIQELQGHVTTLVVVDEANHFFSHIHEFDLNDRLEAILEEIAK